MNKPFINKVILLLGALFFVLVACKNTGEKKDLEKTETEETVTEEVVKEEVEVIKDDHNAENALDWNGTYKGVVPCASCEGVETTIVLNSDMSFTMTELYKGEKDKPFETVGTFTWNENGDIITLEIEKRYPMYRVVENALQMLDIEGNEIKGDLADTYFLKKDM